MAPENTASPATAKKYVLVVDDEAPLRTLARRVLERAGYDVMDVGSGSEAVDVFREHAAEVQVALIDVVMPGEFSGIQVAHKLREAAPDVRLILTTGYATDEHADLLERERIGFVAKPYTAEQLIAAIRHELDRAVG